MTRQEPKKFDPADLRNTVLKMAYAGSTVHIGCAFSIVEILAVLYRNHLNYPGNNPESETRDFLILSKGHGVMAQYACMLELGWIKESQIRNYFSDGSELKGLSDSRIKGLEVTSGSLGHGFSVGVGIAMGLQRLGRNQKVYAIVGDGELNEGAIWEGVMFAAHHKINNFMMIIDMNGFQAMGKTNDIISLDNIQKRLEIFGFETKSIDGHDEKAISLAIEQLWKSDQKKPKAIVARTTKGKGVPFMENNNRWHYTRLNAETLADAISWLGQEKQAT